jgi:hypothetical protein
MSEQGTTRRELVRGGVAATIGGALGGGVIDAIARPADAWGASARAGAGAAALTRALRIEQLVVIAYERVLSAGALNPTSTDTVRGFYLHELQHVSMLRRMLLDLGAAIPSPPSDTASVQRGLNSHHVFRSLTQLGTERDCLRLLIDIESVAEGAYFDAVATLRDAGRMRTAAGIMGCEAQHWTILSGLLNGYNVMRSVPYPFVAGSK